MDKKEKITEQIELISSLKDVTSSIKKNITSDYTLAHLDDNAREYIAENYQNAEYAKEIISRFAKKGYYYKFNDKIGDWERDDEGVPLKIKVEGEEKEVIINDAGRTFEFFMNHPHVLVTLNRNREKNFLVKLLGQDKQEEVPVAYGPDDRSMLEKIKDKLGGGGQSPEDEV